MNQLRQAVYMVGFRRFVILFIFLAINAVLAGLWQEYLLPQHEALTTQKAQLVSKRGKLEQENIEMPKKFAVLKANDDRYEGLKTRGFLQDQDRIEARMQIDALRSETGVQGIDYKIAPQDIVKPADGLALTGTLVHSAIDVNFKGLTDLEIRDFIRAMHEKFNGLVVVKSLEFTAEDPLDEAHLASLSTQQPVSFVKSTAKFDWYSVIPTPLDPAAAAQAQAFGGSK